MVDEIKDSDEALVAGLDTGKKIGRSSGSKALSRTPNPFETYTPALHTTHFLEATAPLATFAASHRLYLC